jgi:hypothetical protein
VTVLFFLVFLLLYSRFLFSHVPQAVSAWMIPVNFILSILVSSLIYRKAIRLFAKKVDMEKYFDPIFTRRSS